MILEPVTIVLVIVGLAVLTATVMLELPVIVIVGHAVLTAIVTQELHVLVMPELVTIVLVTADVPVIANKNSHKWRNFMETYVIHVTKECNCNCTYCYEDDKTSTYTWDEIQELADNIMLYSTGDFTVEFLGGEPLLAFDYIEKTVEYFKENTDQAKGFVITTNGTILTDEITQFLKDNPDVRFAASLDGHKYGNFMRVFKDTNKNTYDTVITNLKRLHSEGVITNVHMVTHPYNIAFLADSIDALYKEGVRSIGIGTVEKTILIDKEYCDRFIAELDKVSERIVAGLYPGLSIGQFDYVKPYSDVRTYMRDETGKVIGESYGRAGDDVTNTDIYNFQKCAGKTPISEMIYYIRKTVYDNHQKRLAQARG